MGAETDQQESAGLVKFRPTVSGPLSSGTCREPFDSDISR
jgi:hypothetical protein